MDSAHCEHFPAACLGLYIHKNSRGCATGDRPRYAPASCSCRHGRASTLMIAALICVVSIAALLQFFISYSRSIIAAYRKATLSDQVREVARITGDTLHGEQFGRLLQLVRLCPQKGDDQGDLSVVQSYYRLMGVVRALGRALSPALSRWAEPRSVHCEYVHVVTPLRRIARKRDAVDPLG